MRVASVIIMISLSVVGVVVSESSRVLSNNIVIINS